MKFDWLIAAGAWTIDYVLSWIRIIVRAGFTPDFLNFSQISEEVMDGFR